MPVSSDHFAAISDRLGRYCWFLDNGDEDSWIALWSENGTLSGLGPQPITGRTALRNVPRRFAEYDGKRRHLLGNVFCDYGVTQNNINVRFYNYVSAWSEGGGESSLLAICEAEFVREDDDWLIKENRLQLLGAPRSR